MYLRSPPSACFAVLSLILAGYQQQAFAQSAAEPTELPPLEVETSTKKAKKKSNDVTNTRLSGTGDASKGAAKKTTGEVTGGLGDQASNGAGIIGASTTVITREQIERSPQTSLPEIISREAGVQTTSTYGGLNGAGTKVDLRGFGAASSSNTLILIDGRRLNDWDQEGFDLSKIAKDSVERIEITRGNSGAVLYGDGAVGGVINIVTRHGAALPNQGRIEGGIGSFQTREGDVSVSGSSGAFSTFLNINTFESDGYRTNNELQQKSGVADLRWTFSRGSVYANFAADDQELGLPGPRNVNPNTNTNQLVTDRRGTGTPNDFANKQDRRGTVGFTYMLDPGAELVVDGSIRDKHQQSGLFVFGGFGSYGDADLTTRSITPRLNLNGQLLGLPSRAIAGVDVFQTEYDSARGSTEGGSYYSIYAGEQTSVAGYWQQTVSVLPSTDISAGGRIQRDKTELDDQLYTFDTPLDSAETNYAWHFGAEHELTRGLTSFARAARSFRVANVDDRVLTETFGDYGLRTQTSHDWEVGLRYGFGGFSIQSSYYDMRLTDEIHFSPLVNGFGANINLDPTRRRGVETIASWQIMKDVRLSGNLTYADATFRSGEFAGNDVPLVSNWTGNVGLSWNIIDKALTFDTIVRYVGDRRMDNDQQNFQPLIPSYTTVDVRLGGQVESFFWSAAVANLFDEEYFDYAIASASLANYGVYNAYPLPGRTFMLKAGSTW